MLNSIFYTLKSWVERPVSLVANSSDAMSTDSLRNRALMMGMPAILIAVLGVTSLSWAKFGMTKDLEKRYLAEADKANREKLKLVEGLNQELRIMQTTEGQGVGDKSIDALIPKDDPRRVELERLQASDVIYREKLISLNPDEREYRYQLALVTLNGGDAQRGISLMKAIAPLEEPGYSKAHLWLSRYYMGARSNDPNERRQILGLAEKHAELCLKRDQKNVIAMRIKASLLFAQGKLKEAYDVYFDLFDRSPEFYERLVSINHSLDRNDRNKNIYRQALQHFDEKLDDQELTVEQWVNAWTHVVTCLAGQQDFSEAERRLVKELEAQSTAGVDGVVKRVFVKQLLSNLYMNWMRTVSADPSQITVQVFDFLKKAYQYNPNNPDVLRGLARLTVSENTELAAAAKQIYDPEAQSDPPAAVLNELGSSSLATGDYEAAIRYFELARKKSPNSSSILNNLAYTYLVCEDRNPERSLKLVDEAIRFLPNDKDSKKTLSHFFDTRGNALMQLNRMTEAIASFEIAIQDRPWNRGILESLVKCYQGSDLSPGIYEERLEQLDARQANGEDAIEPSTASPTSSDSASNSPSDN